VGSSPRERGPNVEEDATLITFRPHTLSVTALAISADGTALASVSHDKWVRVWELSGLAVQALRWEAEIATSAINHCQFSPDGGELYTGGSDGIIRVWATADGAPRREHEPPAGVIRPPSIFAFVLSRTGGELAWCGNAWVVPYEVYTAETQTLQVMRRIPAHAEEVMILAAYPGGFCSGSADRTVKFWDWRSGHCHSTLKARGTVRALATSPDGSRLAVGGVVTVAVYALAGHAVTGAPVVCRGHTKCIECVEFSPDGTKLATASTDGTLRVWDAATGACLRTLALKLGGLHWVTFAPDGLTLAFSSLKGDIGLIDLDG
jgi:WD40 repeat protein